MTTQKTSSLTGLNKTYKFVQKTDEDFACIQLLSGEYKDVVYKHNHIKFAPEPNENDEIPLKFDYDVKVNPNNIDTTSEDFRNYIGDILIEVVEKQLEDGTIRFQK